MRVFPGSKVIHRFRAAVIHPVVGHTALPIFGRVTVAFAAVGSVSAYEITHFEVGSVRPSCSRTYVSPQPLLVYVARCRYRLRGLALPDGTFTRRTTFRVSVLHLFLLSDLHFLVTPHVGAAVRFAEGVG